MPPGIWMSFPEGNGRRWFWPEPWPSSRNSFCWMNPPAAWIPEISRKCCGQCGALPRNRAWGVVIVIHDLNLALRYCDRFLFIRDADVYACGGPETVTDASIRAVYGMEAEILEYGGKKLVVPL